MKILLITLTLMTCAFATESNKVMDFYQGSFELVSVEPMCPASIPNGASCMAIGSIITVKSYAGCLGQKAFFDAQVKSEDGQTKVYITSLIKSDLEMESRIRCIRAQTITEKIIAPMHIYGDVEVINKAIQ